MHRLFMLPFTSPRLGRFALQSFLEKWEKKPEWLKRKHELRRSNLIPVKVIGSGNFGVVWLARLRTGHLRSQRQVAVKQLLDGKALDAVNTHALYAEIDPEIAPETRRKSMKIRRAITRAASAVNEEDAKAAHEDFTTECKILFRFDHPNVVSIIGVAMEARPGLAVLEHAKYGDLKTVLGDCKSSGVEVPQSTCLYFAQQILDGV